MIALYDELQSHTFKDCQSHCLNIAGCCAPEYCERTRAFAKETYGVTLEETGHPVLPFMSEIGCTVKPYLRPECTEFICCIRKHGKKPGDPRWTQKYFALRRKILMIELRNR